MNNLIIESLKKYNQDFCYVNEDFPLIPKDVNNRFSDSVKVSDSLEDEGKYVGILLKENGNKIEDKYLVCIDIDAKEKYGNSPQQQEDLINLVLNHFGLKKYYPNFERTKSGGAHIWLKINEPLVNNGNVVVEKKTIAGEKKERVVKEIEIFFKNHVINVYKELDFSELHEVNRTDLMMLEQFSCFNRSEGSYSDFEEQLECNTGKSSSYLSKALENISELKDFNEGHWNSFDFVKDEVMRFFICLNQEEYFLNIINKNWGKYFKTWEKFPKKYLDATQGNRLPKKNSLHLDWLKKIGFFKQKKTKDKLIENMDNIFNHIAGDRPLKVGDSTFIYNGKSYVWLDPTKYDKLVYSANKTINGTILKKDELGELTHHFVMFLYNEGIEFNPANKLKKMDCVKLAFQNGTLYVKKNEVEFKENYFNPCDNVFIEFSIDYIAGGEEGLFTEWAKARFYTDERLKFFKMMVGDLFSTDSTTDVHGYFWGGAEIGKSTFSSLLQKITVAGTVDFMKLDKIKDKFARVRTLRTPILIADESSERNIPESEYKSTISREPDDYEMKNIQNFNGQPIAKIITFANILPNIKVDAGVKRRLCVLKVGDSKVAENMTKNEFSEAFGSCTDELVKFIIEGIQLCFLYNYDLSGYYKDNFEEEQMNTVLTNDNFQYFISECFDRNKEVDKDHLITPTEAFIIFNEFLATLEGTAMNKISLTKFGMKLRELGIDKKTFRIGEKTGKFLNGITPNEKSYDLLCNYFYSDNIKRDFYRSKSVSLSEK